MIRRPPRSTLSSSSAASDVYKRQKYNIMADAGEMLKDSMHAKYSLKAIANNVQKQGDKMYDVMMGVPGILTDVSDIVKWFKSENIQRNGMKRSGIGGIGKIATQLVWIAVLAVSYTHLRAHETRHDLVCRLL